MKNNQFSSLTPRERMYKLASGVIQMGNPEQAGKGIADIVRFLLRRIEPERRQKSINKLKTKIWNLNEYELSKKKTPNSASMGQSITFIKTILIGHNPYYIRSVLKEVVKYLN